MQGEWAPGERYRGLGTGRAEKTKMAYLFAKLTTFVTAEKEAIQRNQAVGCRRRVAIVGSGRDQKTNHQRQAWNKRLGLRKVVESRLKVVGSMIAGMETELGQTRTL